MRPLNLNNDPFCALARANMDNALEFNEGKDLPQLPKELWSQLESRLQTKSYVACGVEHMIAMSRFGKLYAWGRNHEGQLGLGRADSSSLAGPLKLGLQGHLSPTLIASGSQSTIIALSDGSLRVTGKSVLYDGRFNTLQTITREELRLPDEAQIIAMAVGDTHMAIMISDGSVRMAGINDHMQLGVGFPHDPRGLENTSVTITRRMLQIPPHQYISAVAVGYKHTVIVVSDGTLRTFGNNASGQCGQQVDYPGHGRLITREALRLPDGAYITAVAAGFAHTVIAVSDGTLRTFGMKMWFDGSSFDGDTPEPQVINLNLSAGEKVVDIAAGFSHTVVALNTGYLYTFGNNDCGQLGTDNVGEDGVRRLRRIDLGLPHDVHITSVAAGGMNTALTLSNGLVITCGNNKYGQLGNGGEDPGRLLPGSVRNPHFSTVLAESSTTSLTGAAAAT